MVNHDALCRAYTIILPVNTVPEHLKALGGGQTRVQREKDLVPPICSPEIPVVTSCCQPQLQLCITTSKRPDPV